MDASHELSPHLPQYLRPFHFALVISIVILLALIKKGPPRTTPFFSLVHLIFLDTFIYLLCILSVILFIISVWHTPSDTVSASVLAPWSLLLAVLVYILETKPGRRRLYALWMAAEAISSVTDLTVDISALFHSQTLFLANPTHSSFRRISRQRKITYASSAVCLREPFLSALRIFLFHRSASINSAAPLLEPADLLLPAVSHARTQMTTRVSAPTTSENMRLLSSWTSPLRFVPHPRFGALWHRVTNYSSIDRDPEGAWFIGCEILLSVKRSFGLDYISADHFYDDVCIMWQWPERQSLSFRKRFQIAPVAEQIARENIVDVDLVTNLAYALAGGGVVQHGRERQMAVEANLVAVLGMVISTVYPRLQVDDLWQQLVLVFQGNNITAFEERAVVTAIKSWPRQEIRQLIMDWINDACDEPFYLPAEKCRMI